MVARCTCPGERYKRGESVNGAIVSDPAVPPPCRERDAVYMGYVSGVGRRLVYWSGCYHCEKQGILTRVINERRVGFTSRGAEIIRSWSGWGRLPTRIGLQDMREYAMSHSGSKRALYLLALNQIQTRGIRKSDFAIQAFAKVEAVDVEKKYGEVSPVPTCTCPGICQCSCAAQCRLIQFRRREGALYWRQVVGPIESMFYTLEKTTPTQCLASNRESLGNFGKGKDALATGQLLRKMYDNLSIRGRVIILLLDCSRADAHIGKELQIWFMAMIRHMTCRSGKKIVDMVQEWIIDPPKNRSMGKIEYTTKPVLRSGDMHTSLMANVLFWALYNVFRDMASHTGAQAQGYRDDLGWQGSPIPREEVDFAINGDDVVLMCTQQHADQVEKTIGVFMSWFGVDLRVDGRTSVFEETEWCQSKPVLTPDGYRQVRDPWKVMSVALAGPKWAHLTPKLRDRRIATIGACELIINRGIPILQEWALALLRSVNVDDVGFDELDYTQSSYWRCRLELGVMGGQLRVITPLEISDATRHSFQLAFGLDRTQQLRYEEILRAWQPGQGPVVRDDFCWWNGRFVRPDRPEAADGTSADGNDEQKF